jgi:hypothetical protein
VKYWDQLFVSSCELSYYLGQHFILQYLFATILFKFYSIGSEFTKFGYENNELYN